MPNRGAINGLGNEIGWQRFTPSEPIVRAFTAPGNPTATQPLLGAAIVNARYRYDRQVGNVKYQGYVQFAADTTFGSSDNVWGVLLPIPANRVLGGADQPVGTGFAWQGSAGNRNLNLRPTLMDPLPLGGQQSNEDYYVQFFLEHYFATGSGSIASASTSTTITHGLGGTPAAYDINIMPTATTTNSIIMYYVDTITSTQFNVNVRSAPGASTFAFNWKASVLPNDVNNFDLLVNSLRPFAWASGYVLGWNVEYQARR
jgi:hypothetical protein